LVFNVLGLGFGVEMMLVALYVIKVSELEAYLEPVERHIGFPRVRIRFWCRDDAGGTASNKHILTSSLSLGWSTVLRNLWVSSSGLCSGFCGIGLVVELLAFVGHDFILCASWFNPRVYVGQTTGPRMRMWAKPPAPACVCGPSRRAPHAYVGQRVGPYRWF
jgi:hypothetical protein